MSNNRIDLHTAILSGKFSAVELMQKFDIAPSTLRRHEKMLGVECKRSRPGRQSPMTDSDRENLLLDIRSGTLSAKKIVQKHDISYATLCAYEKIAGVQSMRHEKTRAPQVRNKIINDLKSGLLSTKELALKYGIGFNTIERIKKQSGLTTAIRRGSYNVTDERQKAIIADIKKGMLLVSHIRQKHGITYKTLRRYEKIAGVRVKRRHERKNKGKQ